MKLIYDYTLEELKEYIIQNGGEKYRAGQIFNSLHAGKPFKNINIPKNLKDSLAKDNITEMPEVARHQTSTDGTEKLLLKLHDGNLIECVLLKQNYGNTACISSQAGCRMGCKFCASTISGLARNLSAGEMLLQIIVLNEVVKSQKQVEDRGIKNIVIMGCGEPFDNYDNTVKFLKLCSHAEGINISMRNITVSTCGLVPQIEKLSEENLPVTLALSLHSPFDNKRKQIMPISNKYSIQDAITALKKYFDKTGRRIIIEYSMIADFNISHEDALKLKEILAGLNCHINLIRLNPIEEGSLKACTDKEATAFLNKLTKLGLSATIRRRAGVDIDGACGQLRNKFVGQNDTKI